VGFPGENGIGFRRNISLLEEVKYTGLFAFKYSPRPNTPSLAMDDAIPEEEKGRRLAVVQEKQREIQAAGMRRWPGKRFEVLSAESRAASTSGPGTPHRTA